MKSNLSRAAVIVRSTEPAFVVNLRTICLLQLKHSIHVCRLRGAKALIVAFSHLGLSFFTFICVSLFFSMEVIFLLHILPRLGFA